MFGKPYQKKYNKLILDYFNYTNIFSVLFFKCQN